MIGNYMINIPKTATIELSDLARFVIGLRELCIECNVTSISGLQVFFGDGSVGGYLGLFKETKLFGKG